VKNNKDDSAALAQHAAEITPKLFLALQSLDDLDSTKSTLEDFVKYAACLFMEPCSYSHLCRTLESIAAFSKERAQRSTLSRITKKQNDVDDIKKWEKELTRAYERFNVCFSFSIQNSR
jgi:hypothetical protein